MDWVQKTGFQVLKVWIQGRRNTNSFSYSYTTSKNPFLQGTSKTKNPGLGTRSQLVTQRVWAEPDKNPTSTIFSRPKPEPDFWRETRKNPNPTMKPDQTRRVFVRTKIGNFCGKSSILGQYNLKTPLHLCNYLFSNH